ncbi:E3 ubiquitin-protein ligase TRIM56-like [Lissotriton helveticus]
MDAAVMSLPDAIRKDFLTCKVCFELYKSPKLLPCLHSYCLQCLQLLVKNGSINCPECRLKVDIEGSVSSLRTNFFINSLLEVFKLKQTKNKVCTLCSAIQQSLAATSYCIDCCHFLCQTCTQCHSGQLLTQDHVLVEIEVMNEHPTTGAMLQEACCQEHQQEPMNFFCGTCKLTICRVCCYQSHIQHHVVAMGEAAQRSKSEMKKLLDGLELNIHNICECRKKMDEELEMCQTADTSIRLYIGKYVKKATVHLLEMQSATCETLDMVKKQNLEKYRSLEQVLQRQSDRAMSTKDLALKVMEMGKCSDKMSMEDILRGWVQDVKFCTPQQLDLKFPKLAVIIDEVNIPSIKLFNLELSELKQEDVEESHFEEVSVSTTDPFVNSISTACISSTSSSTENGDPLPSEDRVSLVPLLPAGEGIETVSTGNCSTMPDSSVTGDSMVSGVASVTGDLGSSWNTLETENTQPSENELPSFSRALEEHSNYHRYDFSDDLLDEWDDMYYLDSDDSLDEFDIFDSDSSEWSYENEYDWVVNRKPPPVYCEPEYICSFHVNQVPNSRTPKITGIALLDSGRIVMADEKNADVKIFSRNGNLSKLIILPELRGQPPPCGITVCGDTLVCSAGCYLIFMTLRGKQLHNIKLRGQQSQYAITSYNSDYVAVCEGTRCSLALYEVSGHFLGRVGPAGYTIGRFLFVAVNSQEVFIVSDFFNKTIVLFRKSGEIVNVLDTYTPLLRDPFHVCVDSNDHIFVVDQNRVLEFTCDGVFGRVALRADKITEYPRVIAVDEEGCLIIVQKKNHAKIVHL